MPQASVTLRINDRGLRALFEASPKIANREINRAFQRIGTGFLKEFAKTRLVRGIYQVRRKGGGRGAKGRGQPTVPAKARKAGFSARISGLQSLKTKRLTVGTRNPAVVIRERGGIIRPRRGKYLVIRGDPKGRGASARKKAAKERQVRRFGRVRYSKQVLRKVRQVKIAARLGFLATWDRYHASSAQKIWSDALAKAVNSIARVKSRGSTSRLAS